MDPASHSFRLVSHAQDYASRRLEVDEGGENPAGVLSVRDRIEVEGSEYKCVVY